MKKIISLLIVLLGTFVYSQTKHDKVKELISLSGTFTLSKTVEDELISRYKTKYNHVPENAWVSIAQKIDIGVLVNEVIDIYGNNFTEKEIDQLLIFYKSEVGRKIIRNGVSIGTQIQDLTSNWAMKVTQTINDDLQNMGYLQSPPPPTESGPPPPMAPKNK